MVAACLAALGGDANEWAAQTLRAMAEKASVRGGLAPSREPPEPRLLTRVAVP